MLNLMFFFLEFLTIIMEKELGRNCAENHTGVFLSLCVYCLKDLKPQLELQCLNQTHQLSAGRPCNWTSAEGDECAVISFLLSAWSYHRENKPASHITCTSSWSLTNYKKNKTHSGFYLSQFNQRKWLMTTSWKKVRSLLRCFPAINEHTIGSWV